MSEYGPPVRVGCWCGWRGRRVYRSCEMDHVGACSCNLGKCPKCAGHVVSVEQIRAQRATDRWMETLRSEGVI